MRCLTFLHKRIYLCTSLVHSVLLLLAHNSSETMYLVLYCALFAFEGYSHLQHWPAGKLFVSHLNTHPKYSPAKITDITVAEDVCTVFADPVYFLIKVSVPDNVWTVVVDTSRCCLLDTEAPNGSQHGHSQQPRPLSPGGDKASDNMPCLSMPCTVLFRERDMNS